MAGLTAEAEVSRAHLESSAGILGQQQQLEEAARKQVCHMLASAQADSPGPPVISCCALLQPAEHHNHCRRP